MHRLAPHPHFGLVALAAAVLAASQTPPTPEPPPPEPRPMASQTCPPVRYPATAMRIGLQGQVRVQLTVDLQGHVTQARLVEPSQLTIHSERDPDPPAAQRRAATLALERAALAIARRCTAGCVPAMPAARACSEAGRWEKSSVIEGGE